MLSGTVLSSTLVGNSYAAHDTSTTHRTPIALVPQTNNVLTGLTVGKDGAMYVTFKTTTEKWKTVGITPKGFFPPGANIAMAKQTDSVLTALVVGNNGAIYVAWTAPGGWNKPLNAKEPGPYPPVQITPINQYPKRHAWYEGFDYPKFPPGGNIAITKQTNNMLTALAIDTYGRLNELWVRGTGVWNEAIDPKGAVTIAGILYEGKKVLITPKGPVDCFTISTEVCPPYPPVDMGSGSGFLPGAPIAVHRQNDNILTGLTVDNLGALTSFRVVGNPPWNLDFVTDKKHFYGRLTDTGKFPLGAGIAMAQQADNLLTGLTVGHDGALYVTWAIGGGEWQGPVPISPPNMFPPGASVAMAKQSKDVLTAVAVGNDGALYVSWTAPGGWNKPAGTTGPGPYSPVGISPKGLFPPGAGISMTNFNGVLEALIAGKDGSIHVSWTGPKGWEGPVRIY